MGCWLPLAGSLVVGDIDELVVEFEAGVGQFELLVGLDGWEIPQFLIPPAEELCDAGASSALLVQGNNGDTQPCQTEEKTLLEMRVLAEREVLDDVEEDMV